MRDLKKQKEKVALQNNESEKKTESEKQKQVKHEFSLIVKTPFRDYQKGDHVFDSDEINKILSCHEESMVLKVKTQ